jgi:STE24 endopeptidase
MKPATWTAPAAVAGALGVAQAAVLLLRPREGIIEADPVDPAEYFTAEEIERGRRFRGPQRALGLATGAVDAAAVAYLAARPPGVLRRRRRRPVLASAVAGAALSVVGGALGLPLQAVARKRSLDVGLATQSWRGWASDVAKSSAIGAVISGAASAAGVALMRRFPRMWWLPASGAVVGSAVAMTQLAPVLLDPIFNRFTPLPEGRTRDDVLDLATRAGVDVGEVYEVDASRRTTGANAYVNGLGPTKRVVLFDTLLERFDRDEVRLVVAHELAHVAHRDVAQGLLYLAGVAPATMFAAAALTAGLAPEEDRRPGEAGPASLPALALSVGLLSAATSVVANQLSRRVERRADAYALRLTGAPEPFIGFERRITVQNVGEPEPPRWFQALFGTHPTTAERIGTALAVKRYGASGGA